jgi:hypothetical protein
MTGSIRTGILALLMLLQAPAQTVEAELAEAAAHAAASKVVEAGKAFGRAAAVAQKANDVLTEQLVAAKLSATLLGGKGDHGDVLAAVLGPLDPKRAGAFVSARAIAAELLFLATREGNTDHVTEAATVLAAATASPKSGKAVKALAAYAKGLQVVAAGKAAGAVDPLTETLTVAAAEGWIDVAFHAGTELAAQAVAAGRPEAATAAFAIVGRLFHPGVDPDHVQNWRKVVKSRLRGAAPEVLAPFEEAMKPFGGGTNVASAGGKGGQGQKPGGKSKLGRAWDNLSPTAALANAKRTDDGFELTFAFEAKVTQPLAPGVKNIQEGGVTLQFHGRGVALSNLDLIGTAGAPGDTSYLPAGMPLYRLAKGETWSVSRHGIVSIAGS